MVALGAGCASRTMGKTYSFYGQLPTNGDDPWAPKIEEWQSRERAELGPERAGRAQGRLQHDVGVDVDVPGPGRAHASVNPSRC